MLSRADERDRCLRWRACKYERLNTLSEQRCAAMMMLLMDDDDVDNDDDANIVWLYRKAQQRQPEQHQQTGRLRRTHTTLSSSSFVRFKHLSTFRYNGMSLRVCVYVCVDACVKLWVIYNASLTLFCIICANVS